MAEKRQYGDDASDGQTAKRQRGPDRSRSGGGSHKQQQKQKKHAAKPDSSSWTKKRARAIERRMQRGPDTLPAHVQRDLERELTALRRQLQERQSKKQRAYMIQKYHMIRFFERKKAMRLEKQLRRQLEATEDREMRAAVEADLHIAEIDRLYAIYYPFLEPYVSLYAAEKREKEDEDEKEDGKREKKAKKDKTKETKESEAAQRSKAAQLLHAPRPPLWTVVETTMREGGVRALEKLQARRPPGRAGAEDEQAGEGGHDKTKGKVTRDGKAKRDERASRDGKGDSDSDSDGGGFFEEE